MPQGHQQQLLHFSNSITYWLRAGKCHKAINNSSCTYQAGLLTDWWQANTKGHQGHLLHLSNRITYSLRAGKCHKAISNTSCIYQAGSLTLWVQANAIRLSATALAPIKQDHLLAGAGKFHKAISNSSCTYQAGLLTYWWQANATRPSTTGLPPIKQDHLHTEGRQMPQDYQQQLLHLLSRITYILKVKKVYVSSSANLNILRIHHTPADVIECGNTVSWCCAIIQDDAYILSWP